MLPPDYRLRSMREADYSAIAEICARVYPADTPYMLAELAEHHRRFPEGQVVAEHVPTVALPVFISLCASASRIFMWTIRGMCAPTRALSTMMIPLATRSTEPTSW
jgi:hypothetical protein